MSRVHRPEGEPAAGWLENPMTRRAFIARAAALGISATGLAGLVQACSNAVATQTATLRPSSTWPAYDGLPTVDPPPVSATYGELIPTGEVAILSLPSDSFRPLVDEMAAEAGLPVAQSAVAGRRQTRLTIAAGARSLGPQAYRLDVAANEDGPAVTIRAGDEAGAFYGLLSLGRLFVAGPGGVSVRAAQVEDAPGFTLRGAILDPAPVTGLPTPEERTRLLDRLRTGVRYKLNFLFLPGRTPWPELVRFCRDHHVQVMVGWGYKDWLNTTTRSRLKSDLAAQLDAGADAISLAWDDLPTTNPEALAESHAEVFTDLYGFLRSLRPALPISAVLPPYGGVPGRNLLSWKPGEGERYLAAIRDALPKDVRVFWTGDGGVFSDQITAAGAKAYAEAVGHEVAIWDNNTIYDSRGRRATRGRAADLATVVHTYMGNLAGEANWSGTAGEFALLTSLFYTWNPGRYDPTIAGADAERIIGAGRPLPSATPNRPIPSGDRQVVGVGLSVGRGGPRPESTDLDRSAAGIRQVSTSPTGSTCR